MPFLCISPTSNQAEYADNTVGIHGAHPYGPLAMKALSPLCGSGAQPWLMTA
jgi:hypothetical protein